MHSLNEILFETRKDLKLCIAIEKNNTLCFNKIHSKNLCGKHYTRFRKTGSFDLIKKPKKCKFIDCKNPHKAKGYCLAHYKKYIKPIKICTVNECRNHIHAKELCKKHYERFIKYGDVNGKSSYVPSFPKTHKRRIPERKNFNCISPGCNKDFTNDVIRKGLCKNHYYKWHKYGHY